MIIAQTIVDEIIKQIESAIGQDVTGRGIGIFDINNRVVSLDISNSGEREYLGLTDTRGFYFYIRANGNPNESRITGRTKTGSCGLESRSRIPMKMVIMKSCSDSRALLDAFRKSLYSVNFSRFKPVYKINDIKIQPASFNVVPWQIYKDETGLDPKTFSSSIQIVSIDFNLEYFYNYADECPDFDIC